METLLAVSAMVLTFLSTRWFYRRELIDLEIKAQDYLHEVNYFRKEITSIEEMYHKLLVVYGSEVRLTRRLKAELDKSTSHRVQNHGASEYKQ